MRNLAGLIKKSFDKFDINLKGKIVLTEAATGNYICTPIIAALAGAKVYAIAKNSKYGTIEQIKNEISFVTKQLHLDSIQIITSIDEIKLDQVDVVTNTGFVRPIDQSFINKLKPDCVIPLMWESWEYRPSELDLDAAINRGIKVYGTNESDPRLNTMQYIGLTVLYFLLKEKRTPDTSKILVIGCAKFNKAIQSILNKLNYSVNCFMTDEYSAVEIENYDTIVVAEWNNPKVIIGNATKALINNKSLNDSQLIIHISGNVDFKGMTCNHYPDQPADFGYMSYTTDFINPIAVINLHAAGLKVAEGLLKTKSKGMKGVEFKNYMESNYPAMVFENEKYW